jgi:hypothetical protein
MSAGSDPSPTGKLLDATDARELISWTAANGQPGENDQCRAAWQMGVIILHLKQRYPRSHLSQLVSAGYQIFKAAQAMTDLERGRGNVRH